MIMTDWNICFGFSISALLLLSIAVARAQEPISGPDILVNNPALDVGDTAHDRAQVETSIVVVGPTVCVAWVDFSEANGKSGFGVSTDAGKTFTDRGFFPPNGAGADPSLAYSQRDDAIYYAALGSGGIALWKSVDGCQTFEYVNAIYVDGFEDKEFIGIDNNADSDCYGRIYAGWTDLSLDRDTAVTSYSDDGGLTWSPPKNMLPRVGHYVSTANGMWPGIAPDGRIFFAYKVDIFHTEQHINWSIDGGATWDRNDHEMYSLEWRASDKSVKCSGQSLNGGFYHLTAPQIAVQFSPDSPVGYVVHAVYPYDPDYVGGAPYDPDLDGPDDSDVFYRRSVDGGRTWSPEHRLSDDATDTDQWYATIAANDLGHVVVSWYDRRLDPDNNLAFDRYIAISDDRGLSWRPNHRVSDATSPYVAVGCNHGHYDQIAVDKAKAYVVWAADHGGDPDVYFNQVPLIPRGALQASTRLLILR